MLSDTEDDDKLNSVVFSRKLLHKFMLMYKELPCLWDKNCAAYKLQHKRHEAITRLTELVRQHDPTATRVHVLRKIESLRACVRREHKKVRDSRMIAKTPDDVYEPHLWYYKMMSFLFADSAEDSFYNFSYQGKSNEDNQNTDSEEDHDQVDVDAGAYDHSESYTPRGPKFTCSSKRSGHHSPSISSDTSADTGITGHKPVYGHETNMVEISEFQSKQYSGYEDSEKTKRLCTEVEDEYDAIGVNVAAKLRGLPSNMRILAEKLINDVLFQAQLNGLTPSTTITTPDPFKQDPL